MAHNLKSSSISACSTYKLWMSHGPEQSNPPPPPPHLGRRTVVTPHREVLSPTFWRLRNPSKFWAFQRQKRYRNCCSRLLGERSIVSQKTPHLFLRTLTNRDVAFPATQNTCEPRKDPSYFPFCWLVGRDPSNGLS